MKSRPPMPWKLRARSAAPPPFAAETMHGVFWEAVAARGERIALYQKHLGLWRAQTWRELGADVRAIAMGLAAQGLEPGDMVAILSNTRREWLHADMGALSAGLVSNGIYPTDAPGQCEYLCADSDTRLVFVEDDEQLDKMLKVRARLPRLAKIVVFDDRGLAHYRDPQVMTLEAFKALGRDYDRTHPGEFEARLRSRRAEDLAILVYTSGTTGRPKGAMISHRNLVQSLRLYYPVLPLTEDDTRMCFLPLCHIAERVIGVYSSIQAGAVLNFVENPETVPENVREIQPTVFFAVPRVWEKFYSGITIALREASAVQRAAYGWAIAQGMQVVDAVLAGRPVPAWLKLKYRIGRRIALDNVRRMIGLHRCRIAITGAAPISPDLIRWYLALGVPMAEGWGQTESTALGTVNRIDRIRPGTIGRPPPGVELRISEQGELLLRGPNVFMGYLNQPQKTAETLRGGWLHTGDVGAIDADGTARITDRLRDIIITAGGKNITPSELENQLKFSPYITDAVVIGDRRPYLTALVMIDQEMVERYALEHDIHFTNYASLARAPEVVALIAGEVQRVNEQFARVERIKSFRLIETRLTAEDEEMTPTMKLKRRRVAEKYADVIESMYRQAAAA